MKKFFTYIFLIFTLFNINLIASTTKIDEDKEIQLIEKQISELQERLLLLKNKKNITTVATQPKVAVVLSGGGAKGLAHIGVLRELEKNNIPIDFITGTSMGAIIGAFYSVGYSPDEIENIITSTDFNQFFGNSETNREYLPFEKKGLNKKNTLTVKYDNDFNFYLPKGLNNTNDVYFLLKRILNPVEGITDFDKLPIPLRVIATNLDTGEAVAFKNGDLARAVAASAAIPTIFSPVKIGNAQYIDGMLARNFPVQDAFLMGADIVIGSDVGVVLNKNSNSNYDIMSTFGQILSLSSAKSSAQQKKLATFNIKPDLENFSTIDFSQYKEIIAQGEKATSDSINEIKELVPTSKTIKRESTLSFNDNVTKDQKINLSEVKFKNDNINPKIKNTILNSWDQFKNNEISYSELQTSLYTLQGLEYIDKVFYEIDYNTRALTLDITEVPANSIGLSGNYRSDYGTTFKVNTDILTNGDIDTLTDVSATFGDYYGVALNNFSYYGNANKVGLFTSLSFNQSPLYLYANNHKDSKYISNDTTFLMGIATVINNKFSTSYGVSFVNSSLSQDTGDESQGDSLEYSENYGNTFFKAAYDTLDSLDMPTNGTRGDFIYNWGGSLSSNEGVDSYGPLYSLESHLKLNKKLSLFSNVSGGVISGESILLNDFIKIGGIKNNLNRNELSFAGYHYQNLLVDEAFIGGVGFNYLLLKNFYLIGKYNIGTFSGLIEDDYAYQYDMWSNYISGIELGVSYISIIGPISFALSQNDSEDSDLLIQFSIGYFLD